MISTLRINISTTELVIVNLSTDAARTSPVRASACRQQTRSLHVN